MVTSIENSVGNHVVLVGATGMVGNYVLRHTLQDPNVERVTAISRRPLGISHPKLTQVLHSDFGNCSALGESLAGQDVAIYCLGAYTGVVSDAELHIITVDYTIEFARVFNKSSPNAGLAFLSGQGADPTGKSRIPFARYKGEAEKALVEGAIPFVYIFRPAYIYPVEPRVEPNFGYRFLRVIYPLFRVIFPNQVVRADDLAWAMIDIALKPTRSRSAVFENKDIRAIVERRKGVQGRSFAD